MAGHLMNDIRAVQSKAGTALSRRGVQDNMSSAQASPGPSGS